jgi:uncharacterized protein with HEPN domain
VDAAIAARIPELPQIVTFRNQLIHGYATVNVSTVLNIAQNTLPSLLVAVQALLEVIPPISTDLRSRTFTQPWPDAALG